MTVTIDFQIKLLGALSVGDVRTGTIPSLLPSQKHYLKVYILLQVRHPILRRLCRDCSNLSHCLAFCFLYVT
ncbi:MAG: hypothetical protein V1736_13560 [Pseudomonadota bacterium]